jgi:hypothetical protein
MFILITIAKFQIFMGKLCIVPKFMILGF